MRPENLRKREKRSSTLHPGDARAFPEVSRWESLKRTRSAPGMAVTAAVALQCSSPCVSSNTSGGRQVSRQVKRTGPFVRHAGRSSRWRRHRHPQHRARDVPRREQCKFYKMPLKQWGCNGRKQ